MLKLKRFKELIALLFGYIKTEGLFNAIQRATIFFSRRLKSKSGRFLPPEEALSIQKEYKSGVLTDGLISVVTALYNTDINHLKEYINSFLTQSYQYKQLCVVDASDAAHYYVGEYIKGLNSPYIIYERLAENLGIAENTNIAVSLAQGDYICLADHDDILSPDALFQMARAVDETKAELIYSDEALFTHNYKKPIVGHFKPDFSYFYLTNCNYICHLVAIKKASYNEAGGMSSKYDGAQDHDLFLKLTENDRIKIHHIPRVLYYWRVHQNSTSAGIAAKPYVTKNAIDLLDEHIRRKGIKGKAVEGRFPSTYKIEYELPEIPPLVSIIIPNKDHVVDLDKCLSSIYEKTTYPNFEVIIVENNSKDNTTFDYYKSIIRRYDYISVLEYKDNFNFSRINNFAAKRARGEYFVLLNNDIEIISPTWLTEMVSIGIQKDVGIVGAMLYYPDDTIQHAGVITGLGGYAGHSHKYHQRGKSGYMFRLSCVQNLSCVTAACLLVSKEAYYSVNGMDDSFAVAFNDVDFCLRVGEKGYQVVFNPYISAYHHESRSRGLDTKGAKKDRFDKEKWRLQTRYGKGLLKDPFYNPNLTLDMEDFSESRVLPKYR